MKTPREWASELLRVQDDDDAAILYVCGVELNRYLDTDTAERAAEFFREAIAEKISQAVSAAKAAPTAGT